MNFHNLQDQDWQNLTYSLVLLSSLVIAVLFNRNIKLSFIIKSILLWSLFALVFVILYSYRFEFLELKSKLYRELNPSKPIITKDGKITINIAEDGHFYLDLIINKKEIRFMVDTGATDVSISIDEAKRIGIDVDKLNFNKIYQTANGKSFGASVTLEEIEVNGIKFSNIKASVNKSDMGISLLGMSFLKKFKKYEFYQDTLELTP